MPWACSSCAGENPDGTKFCGHCGTPRAAMVDAPAEPSPVIVENHLAQRFRSFVSGELQDRLLESGGRVREERRLVTSLFADLSGFTSLADRLDPEELLGIVDPVIVALGNIVGRYEGSIEKYAGDALLAFFGAPKAHDDDADRALMVALEMHRELERIRDTLPEGAQGLELHVGINTGHVVSRMLGADVRVEYAVLGDAVILAQRLESVAPPGETYVGERTYLLTRNRFEFEELGPLTLKGKANPVAAWRLIGRKPEAGDGRGRARVRRLIGRASELSVVSEALVETRRGRGAIVAIAGEPGVGKTRLTEEIRRSVPLRWVPTRCLSYGAGLAYWPMTGVVREAIRLEGSEDEGALLERHLSRLGLVDALPFLARLLGLSVGQELIEDLDPEVFRRRLHHSFATWLRALARQEPTAVAIEDVHWIDASSLALARDLAEVCDDAPLVLYLTARPEGLPALREVLGAADVPRASLELGPLTEDGVVDLVGDVLDATPGPALARVVADRSGGNPLFAEELALSLHETGALSRTDGAAELRPGWTPAGVPPTVEGVLAARIDSLPRPIATVLQIGSVVGRRVPLPLLRSVAPDRAALRPALDRLLEGGFLDPGPGEHDEEENFVFHHALIQEVAYDRLLRRHREELHLRVAEAAEELYGAGEESIDLLARHLYLGKAGVRAVDYLVRAGERSRRLFANDAAIVQFERAAEVCRAEPACEERLPAILLDLADLHDLTGGYDEAFRLLEEAGGAGDHVRAWRGMASIHRKKGQYEEALGVLDRALSGGMADDPASASLWLERGWSLAILGRHEEAMAAFRRGLDVLPSRRDPAAAQILLQLARTEERDLRAALAYATEARAIFEELGDLRGLALSYRVVGGISAEMERLDEAADALRRGLELAERVGSVEEIAGCLVNLGFVELRRGAIEEAIALDRRAIEEFERIGHEFGKATAYANLADMLVQRGDLEDAAAYARRALDLADAIGFRWTVADASLTLASIHLQQGSLEAAGEEAERAAAVFEEIESPAYVAKALSMAAEAWERLGDTDRARAASARARSANVPAGSS